MTTVHMVFLISYFVGCAIGVLLFMGGLTIYEKLKERRHERRLDESIKKHQRQVEEMIKRNACQQEMKQ